MSSNRMLGFVVARRETGETDLLLDLLLEDGHVRKSIAKAGVRSVRRFAGGLAPFTLYRFMFGAERPGRLVRLDEAVIERAFPGVLSDLRRTAAAGCGAAIVRALGRDAGADASLFVLYRETLDDLERADPPGAGTALARFATAALVHAGHPVVLDRCVRCDRPAPENARVAVHPALGGVICGACGTGTLSLSSRERRRFRDALAGDGAAFGPEMLAWIAAFVRVQVPVAAEALERAATHWH